MDEGIHGERRDHRAIGVPADLVLGHDLLRGDQHRRGGEGQVGVHVRVAVDLAIAEPVGAMHVNQRHVRIEGGHGVERLAGIGAGDGLGAPDVHEIGAEHGQGRQERQAHGRRAEAKAEPEMTPFLEDHAARLDVLAQDARQPPRKPDAHPGGDDLVDGARDEAPLRLVAHEIAR